MLYKGALLVNYLVKGSLFAVRTRQYVVHTEMTEGKSDLSCSRKCGEKLLAMAHWVPLRERRFNAVAI
jgi:hypothetical protein